MTKTIHGLLLSMITMASCHDKPLIPEQEVRPTAQVKVTSVSAKDMKAQATLTATSVYLQRSQMNAPAAGYITDVKIRYGDKVTRGQLLYTIETKERNAIGDSGLMGDSSLANFGKISIKAPTDGLITTIDRQHSGEYVMEGNPLCTITQSANLVFELNVPFEYHNLVQRSADCTVILPDQSKLKGHIIKPLSSLNPQAQTQQYLVKPDKAIFLPEGLVASVLLTTELRPGVQVLPKGCVLSDELMKNFWIMKLINDSTAIKVEVRPGIRNKDEIEIISPKLGTTDRILYQGNYGLADTALVRVIH